MTYQIKIGQFKITHQICTLGHKLNLVYFFNYILFIYMIININADRKSNNIFLKENKKDNRLLENTC